MVRPTFGQLAPGFVIDGDDAEFGNPISSRWSPSTTTSASSTTWAAPAWCPPTCSTRTSTTSSTTPTAGTGQWAAFDEALSFQNGSSASLYGLELAYSQKLDWLPAPWNGLLLGANATFSKSDADIEGQGMRRSIDLPNHSDTVGNLMVGWENDRLNLRLAANYKSDYLYEVAGIDDNGTTLYVDDQLFVDFKFRLLHHAEPAADLRGAEPDGRVLLRLHRPPFLQRSVRRVRPDLQARPDPDPLLTLPLRCPPFPLRPGTSLRHLEWISHERITQNPAARPVHHPPPASPPVRTRRHRARG